MSKKTYISIFATIVLLSNSCKKEETCPYISNTTTNTPVEVINPDSIFAYVSLTRYCGVNTNGSGDYTQSSGLSAEAFFSNIAFQDEMTDSVYPNGILAGEVLINGDPLEKFGIPNDVIYDNSQTPNPIIAPYNWVISGSADVPAFNFTSQTWFPNFNGFFTFPDTVHTSQNLNLNLGTLGDYTDIYAEIGGYFAGKINVVHQSNLNTLVFNSTDLQNNPPTNNYQKAIRLWFIKKTYKAINGRTYKFQNILSFEKDSLIFVP